MLNLEKDIAEYISQKTADVRDNANINYSWSALLFNVSGKVISDYVLRRVYSKQISEAHLSGAFHIHNLSFGLTGYCAGWNLRKLLLEGFGGVPGKSASRPAGHLDTAMLQMINFFGSLQNEWAGAQAFNSVDTLLAPFIREDKLNYKQVKQAIQKFVYNCNITSRWGAQCVSADTEALTEDGWKMCDEIKQSDNLMTLNTKTQKIEYCKLLQLSTYDYNGELIRIKNRTQDQLVTPNHRVVRKRFNSEKFELINADDLLRFKTPILVPTSGETESKKEINDNLLRLYAWLVSEGCFADGTRNRVYIYQSKKNASNCEEIRDCLRSQGFHWDEIERVTGFAKGPTIRFRIDEKSSRQIRKTVSSKQIPAIIRTLSSRQIKLFINTYVKGDGWIESNGRVRIATKDTSVRDGLQELCTLCGYGTTTALTRTNHVWRINIIRNNITNITQLSKIDYHGKVWCPTTENGTFIARRSGKVFITGNSPFTNITLDWTIPKDLEHERVIVKGKLLNERYGSYQKEADLINRTFLEILLEGDANGRPFTFPIPTYNITKDFDWNSENAELLFKMTAKYGLPYFSNFINSDLKPEDVRSMCCRLRLDLRKLHRNMTAGLFGSGDETGSVGVVTLNLPQLAYTSKSELVFFEKLGKLMDLAAQSLEIKRKVVGENIKRGLLPFTKRYLAGLENHFSTIGLVGMNEACLNLLGKDISNPECKKFALRTLKFMLGKLAEFQSRTGHIFNLEATPAEGCSYRLAKLDKKLHPKIITAGRNEPYYTNSTWLPVNKTADAIAAVQHQEELQALYTGGTVFHTFLGERIEPAACRNFVKKVMTNTKLPYLTITPTYSVCLDHGYLAGEHRRCPKCNKATEIYSRVVGFFRPVQYWNNGKQEEFRQRRTYTL